MGTLGKPQGIYRLDDSDNSVGSFLRRQDVQVILGVSDKDLDVLRFKRLDDEEVIDENVLHKAWNKGLIPNAPPVGTPKRSLNELLLTQVLLKTFPSAKIEPQVQVATKRKKHMDLMLTVPGHGSLFIEFEGPYHFVPFRPGRALQDPFQRKREVEEETKLEVVNWPYWIHECETNARALFDRSIKGVGSLWSTNIHFGDFALDDAASVIETMTARFGAVDASGYGYLYEQDSREMRKPEHPIIKKIQGGMENRSRLVPKGSQDEARWLPRVLVSDS